MKAQQAEAAQVLESHATGPRRCRGRQGPEIPDVRNFEGEPLLLCEARYPFAAGTTGDHIEAVLDGCREFVEPMRHSGIGSV
jgi:hypothetical protein